MDELLMRNHLSMGEQGREGDTETTSASPIDKITFLGNEITFLRNTIAFEFQIAEQQTKEV